MAGMPYNRTQLEKTSSRKLTSLEMEEESVDGGNSPRNNNPTISSPRAYVIEESVPRRKQGRRTVMPGHIEMELAEWYLSKGRVTREELATEARKRFPNPVFTASNRWITRFKKSHGLDRDTLKRRQPPVGLMEEEEEGLLTAMGRRKKKKARRRVEEDEAALALHQLSTMKRYSFRRRELKDEEEDEESDVNFENGSEMEEEVSLFRTRKGKRKPNSRTSPHINPQFEKGLKM